MERAVDDLLGFEVQAENHEGVEIVTEADMHPGGAPVAPVTPRSPALVDAIHAVDLVGAITEPQRAGGAAGAFEVAVVPAVVAGHLGSLRQRVVGGIMGVNWLAQTPEGEVELAVPIQGGVKPAHVPRRCRLEVQTILQPEVGVGLRAGQVHLRVAVVDLPGMEPKAPVDLDAAVTDVQVGAAYGVDRAADRLFRHGEDQE